MGSIVAIGSFLIVIIYILVAVFGYLTWVGSP